MQTDTIVAGADTDGDGIADAWERAQFGNLTTATASSDYDGDGMTDREEYLAGTNPQDPNDNLRITHIERGVPPHSPTYMILEWTSQPTRFYRVERRAAFDAASPWETLISQDLLGWDTVGFDSTGTRYFYRIRAERPLMP